MKNGRKMIKTTLLVIVIILAALAAIMSVTNPTSNEHLKVVAEYLDKYDMSQLDLTEEEMAQYTAYMSSGGNANIIDKVVKPSFEVKDYGLWSVGSFKDKEVTLGLFNNVIMLDSESIGKDLLDRESAPTAAPSDTTKEAKQEAPAQ